MNITAAVIKGVLAFLIYLLIGALFLRPRWSWGFILSGAAGVGLGLGLSDPGVINLIYRLVR